MQQCVRGVVGQARQLQCALQGPAGAGGEVGPVRLAVIQSSVLEGFAVGDVKIGPYERQH